MLYAKTLSGRIIEVAFGLLITAIMLPVMLAAVAGEGAERLCNSVARWEARVVRKCCRHGRTP